VTNTQIYWRVYYQANAEKIKKRAREWYHANRDRSLKSRAEWTRNNPERSRAIKTAHERRRGVQPRRPAAAPEVLAERHRLRTRAWWRSPDGRKYAAAYFGSERGRLARANAYARRRRQAAGGHVRLSTWLLILVSQGRRCYYCRTKFSAAMKPTKDHVIPLSRGGRHEARNLVAACLSCNLHKSARIVA